MLWDQIRIFTMVDFPAEIQASFRPLKMYDFAWIYISPQYLWPGFSEETVFLRF